MLWAIVDEDHDSIVREIIRQKDRGAAIISAAYMETALEEAIKRRLGNHPAVMEKMFKGTGPLATFSAKIDMALLLDIVNIHDHKALDIVRKIRNEFAHNPGAISFKFQKIRDLSNNLYKTVSPKKFKYSLSGLQKLKEQDFPAFTNALIGAMFFAPNNSRGRYIATIRRLLLLCILNAPKKAPQGDSYLLTLHDDGSTKKLKKSKKHKK